MLITSMLLDRDSEKAERERERKREREGLTNDERKGEHDRVMDRERGYGGVETLWQLPPSWGRERLIAGQEGDTKGERKRDGEGEIETESEREKEVEGECT